MSVSAEGLRVYIGTEAKTEIARKVLEHSITIRTEAKIEFIPMLGREWQYPKDIKVGTGFSLRRWMIPAHNKWRGKAIYLDADQIVLADLEELRLLAEMQDSKVPEPVIWTTWQPDKHSPTTRVPQTAVMVIDCARAESHWGFHIDKVIAYLRAKPEGYPGFMHAAWLKGQVGNLPVEWNHLNVYEDGKRVIDQATRKKAKPTKLLHYTKEPEQPWYKPDHPLAQLWQQELVKSLVSGAVTGQDLEAALAKWNVKEDWRNTNGLHPDYQRYLFVSSKKGVRPWQVVEHEAVSEPRDNARRGASCLDPITILLEEAPILWVTSFNRMLHEVSGHGLVESYLRTRSAGRLLCCGEGCADLMPDDPRLVYHALDQDPYLLQWLKQNEAYIPTDLGGTNAGQCRCPGGPYPTHSDKHKQPCIAYWFNRHASRWFRKIASLHHALDVARAEEMRFIVWIDADCQFTASVSTQTVQSWFRVPYRGKFAMRNMDPHGVGVFHFRSKRPVSETGIMGFNLHAKAHGAQALEALFERYESGRYRQDPRWDDSYQTDMVLKHTADLKAADLAKSVGEHAQVVPSSEVGPFIRHDKGKHSRELGLMK